MLIIYNKHFIVKYNYANKRFTITLIRCNKRNEREKLRLLGKNKWF